MEKDDSVKEVPKFVEELAEPNTKVRVLGSITVSEVTPESQAAMKEEAKKDIQETVAAVAPEAAAPAASTEEEAKSEEAAPAEGQEAPAEEVKEEEEGGILDTITAAPTFIGESVGLIDEEGEEEEKPADGEEEEGIVDSMLSGIGLG